MKPSELACKTTEAASLKRTLMLQNQEVLDFEVEPTTGTAHVLDAPEMGMRCWPPSGSTGSI